VISNRPARVDSHHHLWRYTPEEYGWIDDAMQSLRRDYLPEDLEAEARAAGVRATVAVQARQTVAETAWLLQLAAQSELIRGVVGWLPIAADDFPSALERFDAGPLLKGLRHVVQGEPAGFLDGAEFNRGIAALNGTGLVYDVLIFARQLAEATRFIDRHPQQLFVLDHIAKPEIAAGEISQWSKDIRELARRENVICKLSGMVTEADWSHWSPQSLQPYFDTVLQAFGPARLMAGSDWPVLTVACAYGRWWQTIAEWIAPLSAAERAEIESGTAIRTYRLEIPEEEVTR
jgi:L-fuconolactonase